MNILSLFDGISAGQLALKELNIPVEKYYSSEIDKYAISITQHNFPDTIQLGDIEKWRYWDIDWSSIDLIRMKKNGIKRRCYGYKKQRHTLQKKDTI